MPYLSKTDVKKLVMFNRVDNSILSQPATLYDQCLSQNCSRSWEASLLEGSKVPITIGLFNYFWDCGPKSPICCGSHHHFTAAPDFLQFPFLIMIFVHLSFLFLNSTAIKSVSHNIIILQYPLSFLTTISGLEWSMILISVWTFISQWIFTFSFSGIFCGAKIEIVNCSVACCLCPQIKIQNNYCFPRAQLQ